MAHGYRLYNSSGIARRTLVGTLALSEHLRCRDEIGDAKNKNPDYSAAMCILETDTEHEGHGLAFTIGRGNEVCVAAINSLAPMIVGKNMSEFTADMGKFQRFMEEGDSQLRWIGPQKGAIHLATAAVINAVWDLWGKQVGKPVWRIVADLSPEERVKLVDFSSITDAITPEEALEIFKAAEDGKGKRVDEMLKVSLSLERGLTTNFDMRPYLLNGLALLLRVRDLSAPPVRAHGVIARRPDILPM